MTLEQEMNIRRTLLEITIDSKILDRDVESHQTVGGRRSDLDDRQRSLISRLRDLQMEIDRL